MNKQLLKMRRGGRFEPTRDELEAIDEALAAVKRGEVATEAEVEAVFAKYRCRTHIMKHEVR